MNQTASIILPWYRQFWFWMVFGPLIFIVALCAITVAMAFHYSDDVVMDNYYKDGLAINQTLQQDERALALGLSARVRFDRDTKEVFVYLVSNAPLPKTLLLFLDNPVKKTKDQQLLLHATQASEYRAELVSVPEYSWYLALVPETNAQKRKQAEWMLSGEINFSTSSETLLQPRVK
jgi:uncharacterized protein